MHMGELGKRFLDALMLPVAVAAIVGIHASLIQEPRWTMTNVLFLDATFWLGITVVGILVCKVVLDVDNPASEDSDIRNIWLVSSSWVLAAIIFLAVTAGSHDGATKIVSVLVTILFIGVGVIVVRSGRARLKSRRPWFWSSVWVPAGLVAAFYASIEGRTMRPAIAILFVTLLVHIIWRLASWPALPAEDSVEEDARPFPELYQ